ncbi:MAG: hypothetical protein AAF366_02555 [Pseudomonadota bacterium]
MSRHTWMDRTFETARDAEIVLPWSRKARRAAAEAAEVQPQPATARG